MLILRTKYLQEPVTLKNLPTVRQAFVIASSVVFLSFFLAYFVSPVFIFLALVPAFGFMIAGLTGNCLLISLLQKITRDKQE